MPVLSFKKFRKEIWQHYRHHGRILPWRSTNNPYHILVSEIMLQQTQTDRVIPKYRAFIERFPTIKALHRASLRDMLQLWSGLGYNRRALYLKKLAATVVERHSGKLPADFKLLRALPGIGSYTAGAMLAFAFTIPTPFIETNIRRVFIHFFFQKRHNISDRKILPLVKKTMDVKNVREWYWALMDYGVMLGRCKENPNKRSAHYQKQSPFVGSHRELRGKILKLLLTQPAMHVSEIKKYLQVDSHKLHALFDEMRKDGFLLNMHYAQKY